MSKTSQAVAEMPEIPETKIDVEAILRSSVLTQLGKPKDLYQVIVRNVGGSRYRVNVWQHKEPAKETKPAKLAAAEVIRGLRISDSFYIIANSDGAIVKSSPAIVKRY